MTKHQHAFRQGVSVTLIKARMQQQPSQQGYQPLWAQLTAASPAAAEAAHHSSPPASRHYEERGAGHINPVLMTEPTEGASGEAG